jgi:hypothetical protein
VLLASGRAAWIIGALFLTGMAFPVWAGSRDIELLRMEATRAAHMRTVEA